VSLPEETRRAVREDVRRDVGDTGGLIEIEVEFMFIVAMNVAVATGLVSTCSCTSHQR
jgi:hypothetical protein